MRRIMNSKFIARILAKYGYYNIDDKNVVFGYDYMNGNNYVLIDETAALQDAMDDASRQDVAMTKKTWGFGR